MNRKHAMMGMYTAGIATVLVIACTLGIPSIRQNYEVNKYFNEFFQAIKDKNRDKVQQVFYRGLPNVHPKYYDQVFKYPLIGWDITSISGQPWPLDPENIYRNVTAKLYFTLPDQLVEPTGKYKLIQHQTLGRCALVPATIRYLPRPLEHDRIQVELMLPADDADTNWVAPYEGPLVMDTKKK